MGYICVYSLHLDLCGWLDLYETFSVRLWLKSDNLYAHIHVVAATEGFVKCVREGIDGVCFVPDFCEIAVSNEPRMEGNVRPTACFASEFVSHFL